MKAEHRTLLAVVLSGAFFVLWYTVISPPAKPVPALAPEAVTTTGTAEKVAAEAPASTAVVSTTKTDADPQSSLPTRTVTLKNALAELTLTNAGAVATSWRMRDYRVSTDKDAPLMDLAAPQAEGAPTLTLFFGGLEGRIPAVPQFEVVKATETQAVFRWRSPELEIGKTVTLAADAYTADVEVEIVNRAGAAINTKPELLVAGVNAPAVKRGFLSSLTGQPEDVKAIVYDLDGSVHREKQLDARMAKSGKAFWAGVESRYFLSAVIPRVQGEGLEVIAGGSAIKEPSGAHELYAGAVLPALALPAGASGKALFTVYAGPKEIDALSALGVHLEKAIDYGWFSLIAVPILYLLRFFYGLIHNYGVAIILLTILVKLLLHPINVKSLKSMKAMQQLQPRLKELQQKYKDDKQQLNLETMQLFRAHKVNPMGGCLPMLLQFPIYIALYKVLWSSIELYHAPFFWFYRDLAAPDPYLITPILLGIFMVAQQLLTPSASADPAQRKMMLFMPIMFTGFMLFLPVGLVLYILVNTATSVTQQWMYNNGIGFMDLLRGRFRTKPLKT
jgi:YidC/Oxa1 family membrane protein insertase